MGSVLSGQTALFKLQYMMSMLKGKEVLHYSVEMSLNVDVRPTSLKEQNVFSLGHTNMNKDK